MVSIATSPVYNIPKKLSDQEYSQWFVGEPNGKTLENCGVVSLNSLGVGGWFDVDCSRKFCSACDVPSIPDFVLRGLLESNLIENQNVLESMLSFQGFALDRLLMWIMLGLGNTVKILKLIFSEDSKIHCCSMTKAYQVGN